VAQVAGCARAIQSEEGECLRIYRHLKLGVSYLPGLAFQTQSKETASPTIGHYTWPFRAKDSNGLGNQPTALSR
jgi:hypothetical protein